MVVDGDGEQLTCGVPFRHSPNGMHEFWSLEPRVRLECAVRGDYDGEFKQDSAPLVALKPSQFTACDCRDRFRIQMPCTEKSERIVIVGVGGIFPGAPDLNRFWSNIANGIDAGRSVPDGRWYLSAATAFAPWPPQPDRVYSTWGCFIEGFSFDPEGLNIDPELLIRLDPMFHLGLHAARKAAYRDAGVLRGVDHSRVGVILGNIALPTESTSAICRDVLGRTFVENLIDSAAEAIRKSETVDGSDGTNVACTRLSDPLEVATLKASLRRSDWHPLNRVQGRPGCHPV